MGPPRAVVRAQRQRLVHQRVQVDLGQRLAFTLAAAHASSISLSRPSGRFGFITNA